jgi:hypothetical protein
MLNFIPSGFITIRFLQHHLLSNIPLPEGRAGSAWEPSKWAIFVSSLHVVSLIIPFSLAFLSLSLHFSGYNPVTVPSTY